MIVIASETCDRKADDDTDRPTKHAKREIDRLVYWVDVRAASHSHCTVQPGLFGDLVIAINCSSAALQQLGVNRLVKI